MIINSLISLLIVNSVQAGNKDLIYNMKDLEALFADKNFDDFLLHANDIRPSERSKHWNEMYQTMAILLIDSKIKNKEFSEEIYQNLTSIAKNSALKTDEFFQFKYSLYSKHFFEQCYKKKENTTCDKVVMDFFNFKSHMDSDLSYDIVNMLNKESSGLNKWPFYQLMTKDKHASLYCGKDHVQSAILKKVYEDSTYQDFNGNYKTLLFKNINQDCFSKLVAPLKVTLFADNSSSIDKELSYHLLDQTSKLDEKDKNLFYIIYLMNGPLVGDLLNISWKKTELLLENYKMREDLLSKIKKLEILPDNVFRDPNLPRNKAVINLFAKNFPELLNFYGDSCINYINMKSDDDSNIKSTQGCNAFLNMANKERELNWVSDSINTKYSSLKK